MGIDTQRFTLLVGDVRERLAGMETGSVHCIVTSPPYWGLRDYKNPSSVWGGDPFHEHEFDRASVGAGSGGGGAFCDCGAWYGQLGLDPSPDRYIEHMVEVFRGLWRVLRKDGTLWLNMGDCYACQPNGRSAKDTKAAGKDDRAFRDKPISTASHGERNTQGVSPLKGSQRWRAGCGRADGKVDERSQRNRNGAPGVGGSIKPKDLVGMPWRLAFALQEDGWYLRSDIIWAKASAMPESARDRPTKAHEYLFLMAKSPKYYYDRLAILEPASHGENFHGDYDKPGVIRRTARRNGRLGGDTNARLTRNRRTVWNINPQPYPGAHFATFPPDLVRPCIRAGTSAHGVCAACGAPYRRVEKPSDSYAEHLGRDWSVQEQDQAEGRGHFLLPDGTIARQRGVKRARQVAADYRTTGWEPTCRCERRDEVVPAVVLDPFGGTGTTAQVALEEGRSAVLIEVNLGYCPQIRTRLWPWVNGNLFLAPEDRALTPEELAV